jgi:hypothetical protein
MATYSIYCEGNEQSVTFLLREVLRVDRGHVHVAESVEEVLASSAPVLVVGGDGAGSQAQDMRHVPTMTPSQVLALRGRRLFGFGPLGAAVCIAIGMHTYAVAHFGLDELEWEEGDGQRRPLLRTNPSDAGKTDRHPVMGLYLPPTSVLRRELLGLVCPTRAVSYAMVVREANALWTGVPRPEHYWSSAFASKVGRLVHELTASSLAPSSWPSWPIQRESSYSCALLPFGSSPHDDDRFLEFREPGNFRIEVQMKGQPRDVSMFLLTDFLGKYVVGARPRAQERVTLEFTLTERDISENLSGVWMFHMGNFDQERATLCEVSVVQE